MTTNWLKPRHTFTAIRCVLSFFHSEIYACCVLFDLALRLTVLIGDTVGSETIVLIAFVYRFLRLSAQYDQLRFAAI